MRHYELVTILSPILNQEQAVEAWGRIKEFITNREGEITREQTWGTRRLAYPIHKGSHHFLEGNYHITQFSTERPFNQELETFLRQDERVLRSLVVAAAPPSAAPQPVAPAAPVAAAEPVAATEEAPAAAEEAPAEAEPVAQETVVAVAEPVAEETREVARAQVPEAAAEEAPIAEVEEEKPAAEEEEPTQA